MTMFAGELDGRCRSATRCATPSRSTSPARACTAPTTRRPSRARSCTASRCSLSAPSAPFVPVPPNVTTDPGRGPGLSSVAVRRGLHVRRRARGDTVAGSRPTPATGRSFPLITAGRPVQPRADPDVTAAAADDSLLPAHGAVVSRPAYRSDRRRLRRRVQPADARQRRRRTGSSQPVAAFPTRLAGVTTASDTHGLVGPDGVAQRQRLVLDPR